MRITRPRNIRSLFLYAPFPMLFLLGACTFGSTTSSSSATPYASPSPITLGPTWTPRLVQIDTEEPTHEPTQTIVPCDLDQSIPKGWIAFSSRDGGAQDIFILRADGQSLVQLGISSGINSRPAWSPTGDILAIASDIRSSMGDTDIIVVDRDGVIRDHIIMPGSEETNPQWSPDSGKLVYSSLADGNNSIVITELPRKVSTIIPSPYRWNIQPVWSPDGRYILWLGNDGPSGDYLFDVLLFDTIDQAYSVITDGFETYPGIYYAWSSDSEELVLSLLKNSYFHIYTYNLIKQDFSQLTEGNADYLTPSWAPSSELIAFISDREGDYDVFIMNRDGKGIKQLSFTENDDQFPAWSPDGNFIAYLAKTQNDGDEIYLASIDGCISIALTESLLTSVTRPVWNITDSLE